MSFSSIKTKVFSSILFMFFLLFTGVSAFELDELPPFPDPDGPSVVPEEVLNQTNQWAAPVTLDNGVNCFDYYEFQSVDVSLSLDKESYKAGENMMLFGEVINKNPYPIVDGNIFVRFSRENKNASKEGHYNIKEFIIANDLVIVQSGSIGVSYDWILPEYLVAGDYRLDFFYSVGKKFNLGGLPFTNEVIISSINFKIESDNTGYIGFDRSKTQVNGDSYAHIGSIPTFDKGSTVTIFQPLANGFDSEKEIELTYDLYYWDSLNEEDLIDSRKETITIGGRKSKLISYAIPSVEESVYYVKLTAKEKESGYESIVNIRFGSLIEKPRINYPAINMFPISKGDEFTLFSCFHNSSPVGANGKLELTLRDKDENIIDSLTYEGAIPTTMSAYKKDIVAKDDYDFMSLEAVIYNEDGDLMDSYNTVYDCEMFDVCNQEKKEESKDMKNSEVAGNSKVENTNNILIIRIIVLSIVLGGGVVFYFARSKK